MLEHLGYITFDFPTEARPYRGAFVEQMATAISQTGVACTVIQPVRVYDRRHGRLPPLREQVTCPSAPPLVVWRPRFLSFSSRAIGPFNTATITQWMFEWAVGQALQRMAKHPDVLYGHFLYPSGAAAVRQGRHLGTKGFAAAGESTTSNGELLWSIKPLGLPRAKNDFRAACGIVANSTLLKRKLVTQLGVPEERVVVFPNGVDRTKFRLRDRSDIRVKLGLAQERFIVAYVGGFDERKGVQRLACALEGLDVGVIYIGEGKLKPGGRNTIFSGVVPHEQVGEWLSAADIFVLPSLAEGSSNAIIEAMACGLPVVTSHGEFNDDLVDGSTAIRINPLDIEEIRQAVLRLKDDPMLRRRMTMSAIARSEDFDINKRACNVLAWMRMRIFSDCQ